MTAEPSRRGQPKRLRQRFEQTLLAQVRRLPNNEAGVTAIEYAFIAGLIAIAIVAAASSLGSGVSGLFNSVLTGL
jgi:pilus assembly protein Flp/PilA